MLCSISQIIAKSFFRLLLSYNDCVRLIEKYN
jgi:hypothetical protein